MDNYKRLTQKLIVTLCLLFSVGIAMAQDARNYGHTGYDGTFSTGTNASLEDMSSGTTQLIGANTNNTTSAVNNIGFEVWFMGTRFTQFSANCNGVLKLGSAAIVAAGNTPSIGSNDARIAAITSGSTFNSESLPYTGNFQTAPSVGKIHYKVIGTSPNRVLVVEWLNMEIGHRSNSTSYATFQTHVYETAPAPSTTNGGQIYFVYGNMPTDARDGFNTQQDITTRTGIGLGVNTGDFLHVNTSSTPATTTTVTEGTLDGSYTAYGNSLSAGANVPNLHSTSSSSRRYISFEADAVTGVPSNLSSSCITTTTIDLTWSDPGTTNGVGIVIYRSTDGTNYSFLTQTDIGDESYQDTGLTAGTTYYYRLYVVNEGKMSSLGAEASLTVTTAGGGGVVAYAIQSGNWNASSTWSTGSAPNASTSVVISCNYTVTITASGASCDNLTIASGSTLDFSNNGDIDIDGDLSNAGTFDMEGTGISVNLAGSLTNSGTWKTGEATFTLDGSAVQNISNTGTSDYTTSGGGSATYTSTDSDTAIPDNGGSAGGSCSLATSGFTGSNSTSMSVTVPAGTYTLTAVTVSISHTWNADLEIWIVPAGSSTAYQLSSDNGGDSDDYDNVTFSDSGGSSITTANPGDGNAITGTYDPECTTLSSLSASGGTWTLYVNDDAGADTGTLTDFSITLSGSSSSQTVNNLAFYHLVVNNSYNTSDAIVFDDDATIVSDLDLTDGIVNMGGQEMIFIDGATTENGSNTSHVNGQVRKVGNEAFNFPTGNGTYVACLGISAPSDASDEFTVLYTRSDPDTNWDTDTKAVTINNVSRVEYWELNQAVGSSSVYVSLSYDNTRSGGVGSAAGLTIAHWSGGSWVDEGNNLGLPPSFTGLTTNALLSSFSPFTLASTVTAVNPLPVSLLDFSAQKSTDGVVLDWRTATEENSDYFAIERSRDGKTFEQVGQLAAKGETSRVTAYQHLDQGVEQTGTLYYRLRMVDKDGSYEYSAVKELIFDLESFDLLTFGPNPFEDQVKIAYLLPKDGQVNVRLIDLTGRVLKTERLNAQMGKNESQLEGLGALPKGAYILQLHYNGRYVAKKLIK